MATINLREILSLSVSNVALVIQARKYQKKTLWVSTF